MNERIREIAEQAYPHDNNVNICRHHEKLEKFAELIIKECMATCSKQAADWEGEYADAHNDGVGSCISGIKEHFGVEK